MKVPRRKQFPYEEQNYIRDLPSSSQMASEDFEKVQAFIDAGDEEGLKEFMNNRLLDSENLSNTPGLATRDYMSNIMGTSVLRNDPEIAKAALQGSPRDVGRAVRNKMLPGIDTAFKAHDLSTKIENSDSSNDVDTTTNLMRLSGGKGAADSIGTAVHENAHALDNLARRHSSDKYYAKRDGKEIEPKRFATIQKLLADKPALKDSFSEVEGEDEKFIRKTSANELVNKHNRRIENPEIPNFEDYNYETGNFDSDWIKSPVDIQKESGDVHHLDRNQVYENMMKAVKDRNLNRVTKFDKIKKVLA